MITNEIKSKLISAATSVRKNAYAPYSNFRVGAALLCENGNIYIGSNFENVSFGATVCAERVALGQALSHNERSFSAICVSGDREDITPCGICRQALSEFGDIYVICCNSDGTKFREYKLSELLPHAFEEL